MANIILTLAHIVHRRTTKGLVAIDVNFFQTTGRVPKSSLCYDPCKRSRNRLFAPKFSAGSISLEARRSASAFAKQQRGIARWILARRDDVNNQLRPMALGEIL